MSTTQALERSVMNHLLYYRHHLATSGVEDVNQYLASRLPELLHMTDAQMRFVSTESADITKTDHIQAALHDVLLLLKATLNEAEPNIQALILVISTLERLKDLLDEAIHYRNSI